MKSKSLLSILLLVLLMIPCMLNAQDEQLLPLSSNPVLQNYWKNVSVKSNASAQKMQAVGDTIKIPVVDDFSYEGLFPNQDIWIDSNVFINSNFPINPPTVGVATFDGLDKYGNAYDNSNINAIGIADVMTSKPINLFDDGSGNPYGLGDSIWLSFYVERKGRGNNVESTDYLFLEFWDPVNAQWDQVWNLFGGTQDTTFTQYIVKITDAKWLVNGFQFRFSSFGSLTGNVDHWHLDYVILRKTFAPYDNNIDDVAWAYTSTSLLNEYTSVPWNHYKVLSASDQLSLMKTSQSVIFTNVNKIAANIRNVSNNDAMLDINGNTLFSTPGSNTINLNPLAYQQYNWNPPGGWAFPGNIPAVGDASEFTIVNRVSTFPDVNKSNDTIRFKQVFKSYYSYDDGSAEAGYTLLNAPNGKLAMRFDLLQPDTIRAVQIFFSQMNQDASLNLWRLAIWTQLTPTETQIYQQNNLKPAYVDSINGFATYSISDTDLVLSGSFYVGLIQNTGNVYNLGFDTNTDNNPRMWYKTNLGWTNSTIPGTFMIRPVFGDSALIASVPALASKSNIQVYPNPASEVVTIVVPSNNKNNIQVRIYDVMGSLKSDANFTSNDDKKIQLNINQLAPGAYFISVFDGEKTYTQKLIKF